MADAARLHKEWSSFKDGMAKEMITATGLKFNGGLGPKLETLEKNWGKAAGQKAAEEIKKIVPKYKSMLDNATIKKGDFKGGSPYSAQKTAGEKILDNIMTVVTHHKVQG